MSMTTRNFGKQNERSVGGANDQPCDSLDPNVVVQTKDQTIATPAPGDSNSNHFDNLGSGGTSATPGVVVKPAVPDAGKPRTGGSGFPENDPYVV